MCINENFTATENIFLEFLFDISEDFDFIDEQITEEEINIVAAILDYFSENYKVLSLKESATLILTNSVDPNEELYEEIVHFILSEAYIGRAIGKVASTIPRMRSNRLSSKAQAARKSLRSSKNIISRSYYQAKAKSYSDKSRKLSQKASSRESKISNKINKMVPVRAVNTAIGATKAVATAPIKAAKFTANIPKKVASGIGSTAGKIMSHIT